MPSLVVFTYNTLKMQILKIDEFRSQYWICRHLFASQFIPNGQADRFLLGGLLDIQSSPQLLSLLDSFLAVLYTQQLAAGRFIKVPAEAPVLWTMVNAVGGCTHLNRPNGSAAFLLLHLIEKRFHLL